MRKKKEREINIISLSFLDVLANTIGGLVFLLVVAVLLAGVVALVPPKIITERLPDGYANHDYSAWLSAREGLGKFWWTMGEGELPRGLQVDPLSGKLSGLIELDPGERESRKYRFTVICTSTAEETKGSISQDKRQFELTVYNHSPVHSIPLRITTPEVLPTAYHGQAYPLTFAAEGGQAPYTWQGGADMPAGLRLSSTGLITGSPARPGRHTFNVSVRTPSGERTSRTFSLEVAEYRPPPPPTPPLEILTRRLPTATVGEDYQVWPSASGGIPPYRWQLAGAIPAWLAPSEEATAIGGRPNAADVGQSRVILRVSDSESRSLDSSPMILKVIPPPAKETPPLQILTVSLPDARVESPYEVALSATGGYSPYRWTFQGTAVPGLSLSEDTGILQGTPRKGGENSVAVTVSDSMGKRVSRQWRVRVLPPLIPVRMLTSSLPEARVDQEYVFECSAVGGYPPYRWSVLGGDLPPGLAFETETGRMTGKPATAGTWPLRLSVRDAAGQQPERDTALQLTVLTRKGTRKLTIMTKALPTMMVGDDSAVTLASEGGSEPYTWRVRSELPTGLSLKGAELQGEPSQAGRFEVQLLVTDSIGQTDAATLTLVIKHVTPWWMTLLFGLISLLAVVFLIYLLHRLRRLRKETQPIVIPPLTISTKSIPNARASCPYSVQLACIGGEPPYHWEVVSGQLPAGLKLEEDGTIHGSPFEGIKVNETLDVAFTVQVTDNRAQRAQQVL